MSIALLPELRVVELAHATTEYAGKILAEIGAEVILVEPPGGGATRERRPFASAHDPSRRSLPFLARNTDKRSIIVDPTREIDVGPDLARDLGHVVLVQIEGRGQARDIEVRDVSVQIDVDVSIQEDDRGAGLVAQRRDRQVVDQGEGKPAGGQAIVVDGERVRSVGG